MGGTPHSAHPATGFFFFFKGKYCLLGLTDACPGKTGHYMAAGCSGEQGRELHKQGANALLPEGWGTCVTLHWPPSGGIKLQVFRPARHAHEW
jgi:hypothetical protein